MSATRSAPCAWQSLPSPSSGWWAPVEVSAWTMATAFTFSFFSASSIRPKSHVSPHGISIFTSFAPQRPTMSAMRLPNTPAATTTTVSPGSTTFTSAASMPADPVPEIAMVKGFCVRKHRAELRLHLVHDLEELRGRGDRGAASTSRGARAGGRGSGLGRAEGGRAGRARERSFFETS